MSKLRIRSLPSVWNFPSGAWLSSLSYLMSISYWQLELCDAAGLST